jgi:hypothetical protein
MINRKIKIEGIDATFIKLGEAEGKVDRPTVDYIFKTGKLTRHVYHYIKNGVLVLFCSVIVAKAELDWLVRFLKQKVKDQKKKQLFEITVFEFNH